MKTNLKASIRDVIIKPLKCVVALNGKGATLKPEGNDCEVMGQKIILFIPQQIIHPKKAT